MVTPTELQKMFAPGREEIPFEEKEKAVLSEKISIAELIEIIKECDDYGHETETEGLRVLFFILIKIMGNMAAAERLLCANFDYGFCKKEK